MGPKRDWRDVEVTADTPCLLCGMQGRTERAHVMGRKFDRPKEGQKTRWVNPLDIVPLCGPAGDSQSCHYRYDHGQAGILHKLDFARQLRAVELAGSIELARRRLDPQDYHRRIDAARAEVLVAA